MGHCALTEHGRRPWRVSSAHRRPRSSRVPRNPAACLALGAAPTAPLRAPFRSARDSFQAADRPPLALPASKPARQRSQLPLQGEKNLQRLAESEVIHGRWAMLGVAGILFVEVLGLGSWFEAPLWAVNGGAPTYFGIPVPLDIKTVLLLELILMAGVEIQRNEESDPAKRRYPGAPTAPLPHGTPHRQHCTLACAAVRHARAVSDCGSARRCGMRVPCTPARAAH